MLDVGLALVSTSHPPESFSAIADALPAEWIEQALEATGTASMRKRRLPAEQVVLLVIGMALQRHLSIEKVVDNLQIALKSEAHGLVAKASIPAARARLGPRPIRWLFERTAKCWGHRSADANRWRGLGVYAVDGTTMSVPDSDDNAEKFGRKSGTAPAAFPAVRIATLMAVRSRTLAAARFDGINHSEAELCREIWEEIPANSLTLIDRGLATAPTICPLQARENRHWMTRARKNAVWKVIETRAPGDEIVEITVTDATLKQHPGLPKTYLARAIRYRHGKAEESVLLTSLIDTAFPARELVELYHERWEIELGFDELKTHLNDSYQTLRSRTSELVEQELWGLLLAYNLVRVHMESVAKALKVAPLRLSFLAIMDLIRSQLHVEAWYSPGKTAKALERFHLLAKRLVLPERRERSYPRRVKGYPKYPQAGTTSRGAAK